MHKYNTLISMVTYNIENAHAKVAQRNWFSFTNDAILFTNNLVSRNSLLGNVYFAQRNIETRLVKWHISKKKGKKKKNVNTTYNINFYFYSNKYDRIMGICICN